MFNDLNFGVVCSSNAEKVIIRIGMYKGCSVVRHVSPKDQERINY